MAGITSLPLFHRIAGQSSIETFHVKRSIDLLDLGCTQAHAEQSRQGCPGRSAGDTLDRVQDALIFKHANRSVISKRLAASSLKHQITKWVHSTLLETYIVTNVTLLM